jgi:putative heme iron utilization protein
MDPDSLQHLRHLIADRRTATLGTVDETGAPRVALVPIAIAPEGDGLLIHISGLAAHTRDLARDGRAALLLADPESPRRNPATLARLAIQGVARPVHRDDPAYSQAEAAYLARQPEGAITFGLGDFVLVRIEPVGARLVAGFGRAFDVPMDLLAHLLRDALRDHPG